MDAYNRARDITERFASTVARWIEEQGEVFVVLRYLRAAGAKDYAICRSLKAFGAICETVPKGTDIVVFREPQLPLRGKVTEDFIQSATNAVPQGAEYMLAVWEPPSETGMARRVTMGVSHAELRADLEECPGILAAVGVCPRFCDPDNDQMISASKGGVDGPR
ncbi:MAG TPA: hypothetical protein VHC19_12415 [Pirellulales bacterium]|nr:hypothetical protein [Pirellulales bacterium]